MGMNPGLQKMLLGIADEIHMEGERLSPSVIVRRARERNIPVDLDALLPFMHDRWDNGAIVCPPFVTRFIAAYLEARPATTVLDPWAGTGNLLSTVTQVIHPRQALGLTQSQADHDLATVLFENSGIDWQVGAPITLLDQLAQTYDVIVSCPPLGFAPRTHLVSSQGISSEMHTELGHIVLLKASTLLNEEGVGLFVTTTAFMSKRSPRSAYTLLERFGLSVEAALSLPPGTFAPVTSMPGSLVVVTRRATQRLFVGELTPDDQSSSVLLANLKRRHEGPVPQLGMLVDVEQYSSFRALATAREEQRLAKASGLSAVPLSEIATAVNLASGRARDQFADLPNAVYLPLIGTSEAIVSHSDFQIKPHNYVQIVLDPERALAPYIARFYNTSLGKLVRESLLAGDIIPKISKATVGRSNVYLPDLTTQSEVMRVASTITDLATKLSELSRQLSAQPRRHRDIERTVKEIARRDTLEDWLETLPFPIATALWRYTSENDPRLRVDALLHGFEAISEFTATILLSIFDADRGFFEEYGRDALEPATDSGVSDRRQDLFTRTTFGTWNNLGQRLAKTTRRLLSSSTKHEREKLIWVAGEPDVDFLQMLSEKKLHESLHEIADIRNTKKAHIGVWSVRDIRNILALLEEKLSIIRSLISDRYESTNLVIGGESMHRDGVYHFRVQSMFGTRMPLKKILVDTIETMDDGIIYLLPHGRMRPVRILPFFKMLQSPSTENNACYFYNRLEGDGVRWVSYHFDGASEQRNTDDDVLKTLQRLLPSR